MAYYLHVRQNLSRFYKLGNRVSENALPNHDKSKIRINSHMYQIIYLSFLWRWQNTLQSLVTCDFLVVYFISRIIASGLLFWNSADRKIYKSDWRGFYCWKGPQRPSGLTLLLYKSGSGTWRHEATCPMTYR